MDSNGAVMWTLTTDDGRHVHESSSCPWPSLPADIKIAKLGYRGRNSVHELVGYEAYGFQRYALTAATDGRQLGHGAQLIGIRGPRAVIVDIDETTGRSQRKIIPVTELTYARRLLRPCAASS